MAVKDQPTNLNFLSPLGYKFILSRAPNIEYFVQQVTLPGLNLGSAIQVTPFVNIPRPGDKLEFEQMSVTFRVNENLDNYSEIYNWMVALARPERFSQYTLKDRQYLASDEQKDTTVSDISVSILSSAMNGNINFLMRDCFPVNLSSITMTSTDNDVDYVTATATFALRDFTITQL
jgi:hypothetical protein